MSTKVPPWARHRALPRERNDGRVRAQRCHRRMRARPHRSPGRRFFNLTRPLAAVTCLLLVLSAFGARAQAPTPPPAQPAPAAPGAQEKPPEPTTEGLGLDLTEEAKKPPPSTVALPSDKVKDAPVLDEQEPTSAECSHSLRHGSTTAPSVSSGSRETVGDVSTKVPPLVRERALPRERNDGRVRRCVAKDGCELTAP